MQIIPSGSTASRNKIINGDFRVNQYGASTSSYVTPSGGVMYTDRWQSNTGVGSKMSLQLSTSAPPGFTQSLQTTVVATVPSPGATDLYGHRQKIEGLNVADFGFGTASAQSITVSFWVNSSVTGVYGVYVANGAYNRCYTTTYSVSSANTWEKKIITIPGDTTGTWTSDTSIGMVLGFTLCSGSTYVTSSSNTWQGNFYATTSSTVNFMNTNGATCYITGIQLEKGSQATSFEVVDYGTMLARCRRYYWRMSGATNYIANFGGLGMGVDSTHAYIPFQLPVQMRAAPVPGFNNVMLSSFTAQYPVTALPSYVTSVDNALVEYTVGGGLTQYNGYILQSNFSTSGWVDFSAEL